MGGGERIDRSVEERLTMLGLDLPECPKPVASYATATEAFNLVFASGQTPYVDGKLA
jgi:enamine deaminase RidA (YjgF/YER057c/UK114 family)